MCLSDVNKLETMMSCSLSADVQHSILTVAECLYHLVTSSTPPRNAIHFTTETVTALIVRDGKEPKNLYLYSVCVL